MRLGACGRFAGRVAPFCCYILYGHFCFFRCLLCLCFFFFFSSRRRHTRSLRDWSSDVCSSDLTRAQQGLAALVALGAVPIFGGQTLLRARPSIAVGEQAARIYLSWAVMSRSEERRVGKECRSRGARYHEKRKERQ